MRSLYLIAVVLIVSLVSCNKNDGNKDSHLIKQMKKKTHYNEIAEKRAEEKKQPDIAIDLFRKEKKNKNSRYHLYAHLAKNDKKGFKSDKEFDVYYNGGIYIPRENSTGICLLFFYDDGKLHQSYFIRDNFDPEMLKNPPEGVVLRIKHVLNRSDEKYIGRFCSPNRRKQDER